MVVVINSCVSSFSLLEVDSAISINSLAVATDLSVPLMVTSLSTERGIALDILICAPESL